MNRRFLSSTTALCDESWLARICENTVEFGEHAEEVSNVELSLALSAPTMRCPYSNKRGRSNDTNGGNSAKKYQSQAVSLVQNTIEWIIERRLCDYDDETEWRRRKGLEPLPAPKVPKSTAPVKGGNGYAPRMAFSRKDRKADPAYGGASSEVIDLLSDSD